MNWVFISLIAALSFAGADTFIKLASDKMSALSGVVFLHITSGLLALFVMLLMPFLGFAKQEMTQSGIIFSITAGVFTFVGISCFFFMFIKGAPLGIGVTVMFIASMVFTLLISILLLKEALTNQQVLGLLMALVSIYLLAPKS